MKLLFITQIVDKNNRGPLGFVHGWIEAFLKRADKMNVICLQKGTVDLKVPVYSLGKEQKSSRFMYIVRFYKYIFKLHQEYDVVFVHMNAEYILLAGLWWRLSGKKIVLWYNHTYGTWKAKLAMKLAHLICHTSPYAFTAGTEKSVRMPAGIDTHLYKREPGQKRKPHSILFLGRIAPVKDLKTLIYAALIMDKENIDFTLSIYGDALPKDAKYKEEVQVLARPLERKGKIYYGGYVESWKTPKLFSEHEIFVNLTPQGNYDKTILEAMACESISSVSSIAFQDVLHQYMFKESNAADLARVIKSVFKLSEEQRNAEGKKLREYVVKTHDLNVLEERLFDLELQKLLKQ